jgi:two-component system, NtrC family, sensor kinase
MVFGFRYLVILAQGLGYRPESWATHFVSPRTGIGCLSLSLFQPGSSEHSNAWMDAMASEVSTTGEQHALARRVVELEQELGEAHQREAATAESLQVINRPQFALQSVFDAIAQSAGRLCEAEFAFVLRFDGKLLSYAASYGLTPEGVAAWQKNLPRSAAEDTAIGRATLQRAVVQIPDVQADCAYGVYALAQVVTYRSVLAVPFLRDGHPIGGITVGRAQTGRFTESEIRLLQSFADQAVIAIENSQLFEAEHTSKRELLESLEYQTATSEVLGPISRTPTELQPVLAGICKTANRLCETPDAAIFLRDGKWLRVGSVQGSIGAGASDKIALSRGFVAARAFLDREVVHVHDLRAVADEYLEGYESSLKLGHRAIIGVPLMRNEDAIGVLILRRSEVNPFTDKQIQVLKTFADQAVIAVENTRLFEAVQGRTRELTEALEYQTATSEVLNVISPSPTTVDPVFDAIVSSVATLCGAAFSNIQLYDGERLHLAAMYNFTDEAKER